MTSIPGSRRQGFPDGGNPGADLAAIPDRRSQGFRPTWLLALWLLLLGTAAHAADLLDQVAARVKPVPVLRGEFTQERTLVGFSKPLRSSGHFVAARGHGVLWSTEQPFPGLLIISADAIRERVDGEQSFELDAEREPALREVNRILLALLQGDVGALREQFVIAGTVDASAWELQLTPQGAVANMIGTIAIGGAAQVQTVDIREASGDVSRIEFSALASEPATLSAAELADFD